MPLATSNARNLTASAKAAQASPRVLPRRADSSSPLESHQLGNSFCSVIASLEKVCSNHAADMLSARTDESVDHASQRVATHAVARAIDRACSRSRGSHATIAMQQIPPTVAGMTTKAIMNGSRSAK